MKSEMRTSATKAGLCLCKLGKHEGVELYLNLTLECGERSDPCPSLFSLGKIFLNPLNGRLSVPQSLSGSCGEKKIIASLAV